ncbi:uncharacterized protein HMPREF1120_07806 [Exophiala dermatitidis NIH/UT8656]|uniref:Uncharacterized protein n=1 Tax=Exophiala dermatitidis (strain ATCC 34100 / CBS 525.76 / NIH/UT8656) TaxID=858893 RepID=H6C5G7_EXODN|nr:uncharacterized protein HMPREF1120_07806 [Exophiala dermatitidis NIH/UT8656]EHY59826.1 hypothetical protein HMPREF1120_07806 [Exophiala dermatitidis NIH/UT8656]
MTTEAIRYQACLFFGDAYFLSRNSDHIIPRESAPIICNERCVLDHRSDLDVRPNTAQPLHRVPLPACLTVIIGQDWNELQEGSRGSGTCRDHSSAVVYNWLTSSLSVKEVQSGNHNLDPTIDMPR